MDTVESFPGLHETWPNRHAQCASNTFHRFSSALAEVWVRFGGCVDHYLHTKVCISPRTIRDRAIGASAMAAPNTYHFIFVKTMYRKQKTHKIEALLSTGKTQAQVASLFDTVPDADYFGTEKKMGASPLPTTFPRVKPILAETSNFRPKPVKKTECGLYV